MPIPAPGRRFALIALAAALPVAGCEDPFGTSDPVPLPPAPIQVHLSDFRTGPLREPPAFQLSGAVPTFPSRSTDWDFVFWVTEEGEPQFRPRTMIVDGESEAGLTRVESTFESVGEAPSEGYTTAEPVPVDSGTVYVVRSGQDPSVGIRCLRYGKIEVSGVDPEDGTVTFRHLVNPNCGLRNLTPPEDSVE